MVKLIFKNTNCSINKGSAAQVISTYETLKSQIPDLSVTLISPYPELDEKACQPYGIKVIGAMWLSLPPKRILRGVYNLALHNPIELLLAGLFRCGMSPGLIKNQIVQEYLSADAVIDLSGDSYSDGKGGFSVNIDSSIIFAKAMKKPVFIYSQSIGPFRKNLESLARYCLNEVDLIIVREEITKGYLESLGVKSHIHITSDCAFLLNPASHDRVMEILSDEKIDLGDKPLVGISANSMLSDSESYANTMAQVVDYITEQFDARVIFIPHVVSLKKGGAKDDRVMDEKILSLAKNKDRIHLIRGDYSPTELKGIISLCDIFIGGRMHADIAAISSYVPTLATAWSHKYYGIMHNVGLDEYVCDFRTMDFNGLKAKIDDLYTNRESIQNDLRDKVDAQKKLAWHSAELVKQALMKTEAIDSKA